MPSSPAMRMHRLTLTFADREVETEYIATRATDLAPSVRSGVALAGVLWALAGPVGHALKPSVSWALDRVFYWYMVPVHVLVVLAVSYGPGKRRPEIVGALLNLSSGSAMLMVASILDRSDFSYALIMVQVVFACLALRLPFPFAFLATLPQVVGWGVLEGLHAADGTLMARAFLLFTVWIAALTGAYSIDRSDRRAFLQDRLILEQKARIEAEQEKAERLLLNVLPAPIAARLKEDAGSIADAFEDVTVLFSDLVGFTALSAKLSPEKLVQMLDALFTRFDALAERHGLEKIKTIGDAYMAVAGLPEPRTDHAVAAARMALDMQSEVESFAHETGHDLAIRVGLHSGPVVAGVIGKKKFIYDLWGDTVNTASRMESHGVPGRVHLSDRTHALLDGCMTSEDRGTITVKGKGELRTWLLSKP